MTTSLSNFAAKVQLLEINAAEAKVYAPMTRSELERFISEKYADQPVSYFNNARRLYVIELGARPEVRALSLRVEI